MAALMEVDVAIIGGGLAGRVLARKLQDRMTVVVVDDGNARASDVPIALLQPFPGWSIRRKKVELQAYVQGTTLVASVDGVHRNVTMRRFIDQDHRRQRLKSQAQEERHVFQWLDGHLADGFHADFGEDEGGEFLEYGPVWLVDMPLMLEGIKPENLLKTSAQELHQRNARWHIVHDDGEISAKKVVLAGGARIEAFRSVENLRHVPGAVLRGRSGEALDRVLGFGTNILPCPHHSNEFLVAATFRKMTQHQAQAYLSSVAARHFGEDFEVLGLWHGVRCMVPGHRPICDEMEENLFVLGALGSRGLTWTDYYADKLAARILERGAP